MGLLVIPIGCGMFPTGDDDKVKFVNPLDLTPRENEEAELMALWLSGELVAPTDLYDSIVTELALIREQWADSLAFWDDSLDCCQGSLTFTPTWTAGTVNITAPKPVYDSAVSGTHHQFNKIMNEYRALIPINYYELFGKTHFSMVSDELISPYVMKNEIEKIDGVLYASFGPFLGSTANVYRLATDDGIRYFWDFAWGDCPAGCIFGHIFYFEVTDGIVSLIDTHTWRTRDEEPVWFDTFRTVVGNWYKGIPQSEFEF